jgi:hypothetical protein
MNHKQHQTTLYKLNREIIKDQSAQSPVLRSIRHAWALCGEVLSFQRFDAEKLKTSVQKVEEINRRSGHATPGHGRYGEGWKNSPRFCDPKVKILLSLQALNEFISI